MDVIPASSVIRDAFYGYQGHAVPDDKDFEPNIHRKPGKCGLFRETVYQLGEGLSIAHLSSNKSSISPLKVALLSTECRWM